MPDNSVKLVYYMGAGASVNALPVAKDMPARMNRLADLIPADTAFRPSIHPEQVEPICKDMRWLAKSAADRSVDVLARRYYLQKHSDDLLRLKKALSVFVLLEQAPKPADFRYGDFFAYLLGHDSAGKIAMPTDVRVISWNYDQQFQRAFAEFFHPDRDNRDVGEMLQVMPANTSQELQKSFYDDIFSICKLNGNAGVRLIDAKTASHMPDSYVNNDPKYDRQDAMTAATHFYEHERHKPELRFAWERDRRRDDALERIEKWRVPVDSVVVIGYSFPLFNRDLDRKILVDTLKPKRVYVQVAGDDAAVTDRLVGLGIDRASIDVVHDQSQFHIPPTYSPTERMSRATRAQQEQTR